MSVAGADWPNIKFAVFFPHRENHKQRAAFRIVTDSAKSRLAFVRITGDQGVRILNQRLDFPNRDAPSALLSVAVIPIEFRHLGVYTNGRTMSKMATQRLVSTRSGDLASWRHSPPHRAHARLEIDACAPRDRPAWLALGFRPGLAIEMFQERRGKKPGAAREHAAVAVFRLAVDIEALRNDERQLVARAGHRDIEQAALLLDLLGRAGREIGRNAAVDAVEHEDRAPFLPLGRMDGREDEIVLIPQRRPRFVAGRVRRIERELAQETLA